MKWIKKISVFLEKEQVKRLICYAAAFTVILGVTFIMVKARVEDEIVPYATFVENNDEEQFVRNLTAGMTLEQEFASPRDFEVITLSCSNHEKSLSGYMVLEVYDLQGELITSKTVQNQEVVYEIPVEIPMDGKKAQTYLIKVSAYDTEDEAIGFFGYLPEKREKTAILDGKKSEYALSIGIHNYTGLFRNLLKLIFIVMFAGLIALLAVLWKRELPPEKAFLILAIPVGVALLCFLSVNFINDGEAHFARAYHYANVVLGVAQKDMDDYITMRADDVDTLYSSGFQDQQHAQNMYHIYENWSWFAKDSTLVNKVKWRSAGKTSSVAYLPSIIGIVVARFLHLGTYPMVYLARIFPFLCYLLGCYYAIKITPVGKHVMAFLAALPMSIQQATGITYDNVSYIALFLLISCTLKIYFEGAAKRERVLLILSCMMLGICKGGIYTPMLLVLLFLPKEKMGGIKKKAQYIILVGVLTVCVAVAGYGTVILNYIHPQTVVVEEEKDPDSASEDDKKSDEKIVVRNYGIDYCIKEPAGFIKVVINTIIERTGYYVEGMIGRMAAWAVEKLPVWSCILFGFIILLAKNGIGEEQYQLGTGMKLGMLLTFAVVMGAFFVLFLIETPYYNSYIWGIQGRYFIPLIMLVLLGGRNNGVIQKKRSENMLYISYYAQTILFMLGYYLVFMTQTYNH